jgi:hypothetical protein
MALEGNISSVIGRRYSSRAVDVLISDLAARQHGVVGRGQLVALGVGQRAIDHRIARRQLHPVHAGVFAVGHPLRSATGSWMAAVLACGEGAVLSHRSAAALWGVRRFDGRPHVTVGRTLRRPGIHTHRVALPPDEVTTELGIPVTTPARTLFDLAGLVTRQRLEAAITEAEVRRLTSPTSLADLVARYPGRRGIATLRAVLEDTGSLGRTLTRSELEIAFLALVDTNGLPRPITNRKSDHGELDATWPAARLVVELDGFATHGTRRAFEADRARDRALLLAGWRVVRLTARQLTTDGETIARQLRILLGDTVSACPKP